MNLKLTFCPTLTMPSISTSGSFGGFAKASSRYIKLGISSTIPSAKSSHSFQFLPIFVSTKV